MWRDICLANREALLRELQRYQNEISKLNQALENNDAARLEEVFSLAKAVRSSWSH
jgi:prephenate dehydrogenase